jgi:hypothetical protein
MLNGKELAMEAQKMLDESKEPEPEITEYVTEDDVAVAAEDAEKAIIQAKQTAGLNGEKEYTVDPFVEPTSLQDILKAKLDAAFGNEYTTESLYKLVAPLMEKVNGAALSKDLRESIADTFISGVQARTAEAQVQSEINEAAKANLLAKYEVRETAKEFEESLTKQFGITAKEIIKALPVNEYLNRVLAFKQEQKTLFEQWKIGVKAPEKVANNADYVKNSKENEAIKMLAKNLSKVY